MEVGVKGEYEPAETAQPEVGGSPVATLELAKDAEADVLGFNNTCIGDFDDILQELFPGEDMALTNEMTLVSTDLSIPQQVDSDLFSPLEFGDDSNNPGKYIESASERHKKPKKPGDDRQGGSAAERQRRYREKKKQEEKCIEMQLQNATAALRGVNDQNIDLKMRESAMLSLVDSLDSYPAMQTEDVHIGEMYASVLSAFKKEVLEHEDTAERSRGFQSVIQLVPNQKMYLMFREQVNSLLQEYDAFPNDAIQRKSIEVQLKRLFGMRTDAIGRLAQKHPKIVLSHLIEGWVGEKYNEGIMPQTPHRFSNTTVKALVHHLKMSSEQIEALCKHWESFLALWNTSSDTLQKYISQLPACPNIQEIHETSDVNTKTGTISDVLRSRGLRGAMENKCSVQAVTRDLDNLSEEQILSVLGLAGNICTVLSPIQKARLCVFYSSAPNCMYLPFMLTNSLS